MKKGGKSINDSECESLLRSPISHLVDLCQVITHLLTRLSTSSTSVPLVKSLISSNLLVSSEDNPE
jgi:hypothetical protein